MNPSGRQPVSRRAALVRLGRLGLMAGVLGPLALRSWAKPAKSEFKFLVVNDTHYLTDECGRYLAGLVRQMNGEGADFVLHAGDLTDQGEPAHLTAVRKIFAGLDGSFYPVIGNHDYLTPKDRHGYTAAFPRRLNYSFERHGWQFIGLDTTQGQEYFNTRIQPATFKALAGIQRRLDKAKPTVVFTHFPLCASVRTRPVNADDLLVQFDGWNVRAMFSGHFHGFTECERGAARLTTDRCCSLKRNNHDGAREKGYFVCTAKAGELARQFVEYKGV
ncbi:MAG TPA: metallophosphoesterase [Verrucomicrobiae bacterium]|nr:metallophosphoesterase [Verrucomicrobiae bacterium]